MPRGVGACMPGGWGCACLGVVGDVCLGACVAGGGHAWQERWPLQRAVVRILLECIPVVNNSKFQSKYDT